MKRNKQQTRDKRRAKTAKRNSKYATKRGWFSEHMRPEAQ
jgi:hypothetical protein